MKRFAFFAVAMVLAGCSDNVFEDTVYGLYGHYDCASMVWEGEAIDVDGDGQSGTDMIEEFKECPNAMLAIHSGADVDFLSGKGIAYITVGFPMQSIRFLKKQDSYAWINPSGMSATLRFSYSVSKTGEVSTSMVEGIKDNYVVYFEDDSRSDYVDYAQTEDEEIVSFGDNGMVISVRACYYDWSRGELVYGKVVSEYRRNTTL